MIGTGLRIESRLGRFGTWEKAFSETRGKMRKKGGKNNFKMHVYVCTSMSALIFSSGR